MTASRRRTEREIFGHVDTLFVNSITTNNRAAQSIGNSLRARHGCRPSQGFRGLMNSTDVVLQAELMRMCQRNAGVAATEVEIIDQLRTIRAEWDPLVRVCVKITNACG